MCKFFPRKKQTKNEKNKTKAKRKLYKLVIS